MDRTTALQTIATHDRIHWASTETSPAYAGHLEGAIIAARACALGAALRGPGLVGSGLDAVAAHLGDLRGLRGAGEPEGMAAAHPPRAHLLGGLRPAVAAGAEQRPARVIGEPFGNSSCLARGPLRGELAHDGDAGRLAAVARTCDLHECPFIDPVGLAGAVGPRVGVVISRARWWTSSSVDPTGTRVDPAGTSVELTHLRAQLRVRAGDRKSTRLNSSHVAISYAVFCLKKNRVERA